MRRELYHGGLSNIGKTFAVFVAFIYRRRFSIEPILPHFAQPIRDSRVPRRKQPIIIRFLCYYSKNVVVTDELPPPHNHTYGFAVSPRSADRTGRGRFRRGSALRVQKCQPAQIGGAGDMLPARTMKKREPITSKEADFHAPFPELSNGGIFIPRQETGAMYNDISRKTAAFKRLAFCNLPERSLPPASENPQNMGVSQT